MKNKNICHYQKCLFRSICGIKYAKFATLTNKFVTCKRCKKIIKKENKAIKKIEKQLVRIYPNRFKKSSEILGKEK